MPALGCIPTVDARDRLFSLASITPIGVELPPFKFWTTGPILDQGNAPECVGFGGKQWLMSSPIRDPYADPPTPHQLYVETQARDGIPLPHDGTDPHAMLRYFQELEKIESYHWAWSSQDTNAYIGTVGGVWFACPWYGDVNQMSGMFRPDSRGFLHVDPTLPLAGWHFTFFSGMNSRTRAKRGINSWGLGWGQRGRFWLSCDDEDKLYSLGAFACAAKEM